VTDGGLSARADEWTFSTVCQAVAVKPGSETDFPLRRRDKYVSGTGFWRQSALVFSSGNNPRIVCLGIIREKACRCGNNAPHVFQHGVVDAVFNFIHQRHALLRLSDGQNQRGKPSRSVAKQRKGYRIKAAFLMTPHHGGALRRKNLDFSQAWFDDL
jgi:hypothetical protein